MKKIFIILILILMLTFLFRSQSKAEEGLVLHYIFDEGSGSVVQDKSGNGKDGQIHGAQYEKVEQGYALRFDGVDDYVDCGNPASLDITDKITLEAWVQIEESRAEPLIVGKETLSGYGLTHYENGEYYFYIRIEGDTQYSISAPRILNTWQHVVGTYDGERMCLYINGNMVTFKPLTGKIRSEPETNVKIGTRAGDRPHFHKGLIVNVRIYNRALSAAEVSKHYLESNPVSVPKPEKKPVESLKVKPVPKKSSAPTGEPLYMVKDGKALCTIVVPKDADRWINQAAQWLKEYVYKVSGANLEIVGEDENPSGILISVGHTKLAEKDGISTNDLKWDGCKMIAKENILYLLGKDDKELKNPYNPNRGARGTCRAVLMFLEKFCGVRWFNPGPMGEFVPKKSNIPIPENLEETFIPAFAFSDGRFPYDSEFLITGGATPGALANNYRIGITANTGGHTYYWMVPAEKYFKEHPEYFALINGQRTGEGNHLCTTNPDVRHLMLSGMKKMIDAGFDIVSIGQEDGYLRCECPECEKLDNYRWDPNTRAYQDFLYDDQGMKNTPADRLFLTHKWVIDELKKSYPDKKVLLMSYGPTTWPSKKIDYWGDNVWVELSLQEQEVIDAWKDKVNGITGYIYMGDIQFPMGLDVHATPKEAAEKIRYYHNNRFIGFYGPLQEIWGFQGPIIYEIGKLMGNPDLDYRALVKEYCEGVYEKAGKTMLEFYDLLYAGREEILPIEMRRPVKHPKWMTTHDIYIMHYPLEKLNQLEKLLQKAEIEADTERARGWVKLTRDHFDFTKLLTHMVIAYKAYQKDKNKENWLELKKRVEDFDNYRMKIITYDKEYTDVWFPGYESFCNWLTADCQHESKVYYTSWWERKAEVLKKGVKGTGIGYGGGFGYSYIKEPLTLDFGKEGQ